MMKYMQLIVQLADGRLLLNRTNTGSVYTSWNAFKSKIVNDEPFEGVMHGIMYNHLGKDWKDIKKESSFAVVGTEMLTIPTNRIVFICLLKLSKAIRFKVKTNEEYKAVYPNALMDKISLTGKEPFPGDTTPILNSIFPEVFGKDIL